MRSSFLSFAPDVSKEQCRVEHWIDTGNAPGTVKMTPEEIENFPAAGRGREVARDCCKKKSHPCTICDRNCLQFKQIVEGVAGGAESVRFCGFAKGKTADGSNQRFEARHLAGELAPPSTSLSKSLF